MGQGLQMRPDSARDVIMACAFLHNISKDMHQPEVDIQCARGQGMPAVSPKCTEWSCWARVNHSKLFRLNWIPATNFSAVTKKSIS